MDELNEALQSDTLHTHHIIFFSEGGENIEENLMLVCPSCHARIHKRPDLFPLERLKEAKHHWITMRDLVPRDLMYETDDGERLFENETVTVLFAVESFNLSYVIHVPPVVQVGELSRFIANWILRPLVFYSRTAPYTSILSKAHIGRIGLALKSDPERVLDRELAVAEIPNVQAETLIALADLRMVHALIRELEEEEPEAIETVTLRWGETPRDLDLHFFIKTGDRRDHIWYQRLGTLKEYPWAQLSSDITTGFGPETVSFGLLARGQYQIAVHNFSRDGTLAGCNATVEATIRDKKLVYTCPESGDGDWWIVFEFDVETGQVAEINKIVNEPIHR